MLRKPINYFKLAAMAGAVGIALGQSVEAATLFADDFDTTAVDAGDNYSYWDARGGDPTAWSSTGNWWYNASYDSARRPTPRSGTQAIHGGADYNWVILSDQFKSNTKYTFSLWTQGDSDSTGDALAGTDSVWAYLYVGDAPGIDAEGRPGADGNFDNNSLFGVQFTADGSTNETVNSIGGVIEPFAGFERSGGSEWKEAAISFTTGDSDAILGKPIGVAFYGRSDAAIDDVSLDAQTIPEPSTSALSMLGAVALLFRRRRR